MPQFQKVKVLFELFNNSQIAGHVNGLMLSTLMGQTEAILHLLFPFPSLSLGFSELLLHLNCPFQQVSRLTTNNSAPKCSHRLYQVDKFCLFYISFYSVAKFWSKILCNFSCLCNQSVSMNLLHCQLQYVRKMGREVLVTLVGAGKLPDVHQKMGWKVSLNDPQHMVTCSCANWCCLELSPIMRFVTKNLTLI